MLAAAPRISASDLVRFETRQAAELSAAHRPTTATGWASWLVGSSSTPLTTQLQALFTDLPNPAGSWVVTLGLLDGATAVLVFVAVRSMVGPTPAVLAGTIYALSPWAWTLAREPAPRALPVLVAAALWAGLAYARAPRARLAALLGTLGALLVRVDPTGWVYLLPLATTLSLVRPSRRIVGAGALALLLLGGPALARAAAGVRTAGAEPIETAQVFWWLAAGWTGSEPRLGGWTTPIGALRRAQDLALACGGLLLTLGAAVAVVAGARRARGFLVPLVWTALPLAAFAVTSPEPSVEPLAGLLPMASVLMAMPVAARGWRVAGPLRRVGLLAGAVIVGVGVLTLGGLLWRVTSTESASPLGPSTLRARGAELPAPDGPSGAPPTTLRFWAAIADASTVAAERTGARELAVLPGGGPLREGAAIVGSLLEGRLAVRSLPAEAVPLPIEEETLYVLLPGGETPTELSWPSARLATITLPGADSSARLVSLRPRPVLHWLAGVPQAPETRFADGSTLLGATWSTGGPDSDFTLELYWTFDAAGAGQAEARFVELRAGADDRQPGAARAELPGADARRAGELVVQRIAFPGLSASPGSAGIHDRDWSVRLIGADGSTVPPVSGAGPSGEVPLFPPRSQAR